LSLQALAFAPPGERHAVHESLAEVRVADNLNAVVGHQASHWTNLVDDHAPLVAVALSGLVSEFDLHHRVGQAFLLALVPELLERAVASNGGGVANTGSALDRLAVTLEFDRLG
jgi:hypothetical protein